MMRELPDAWIQEAIKPEIEWKRLERPGSGPTICEEYNIQLSDVLSIPGDARKTGQGYLIKHPIHGATGNGNLSINVSTDQWYCFHCQAGGDPLIWLAVREGFIECVDAGPLDKETVKKCLDVLRKEGLAPEEPEIYSSSTEGSQEADPPPNMWYNVDATSAVITINGAQKKLKLPSIPEMVIVDGPKTIEDLLVVYKEHLYIEEDYNVIGPVCAFLCNFTPYDPNIVGIIGPSGSIKTEIVRAFGETQNKFCYPLSSITEHTLISGIEKNVDTVPLLRGRVLAIKDLTTLLSKNEDIRSSIFADFREVSDGYLHKEFGNGVKKEYHDIHSSILFASTPAIERYYSMYSQLGQRMLFMRPQNDPIQARIKSKENQAKGIKGIRKTLQDSMLSFVDANVARLMSEPLPTIPEEIDNRIGV